MPLNFSPDGLAFYLVVTVAAVLAAIGVVALLGRLLRPRRRSARELLREAEARAAFLFDDETLVDATAAGRNLFRLADTRGSDYETLLALLAPQFPDLATRLAGLASQGSLTVTSNDGQCTLEAELWDGLARLTLHEAADAPAAFAALSNAAIEEELQTLRAIGEDAPQLIWKEDMQGNVSWANRAYLALCDRLQPLADGADPAWPPARIFGEGPAGAQPGQPTVHRQALTVPDMEAQQWFEVTRVRRGDGLVNFAADANGIVRAEHAQKNFVQTLTKTFAHLSIGLAIFDRQRRLVLFNPAFLDLTGLPVTFLSARPIVQSVLDRLRDINMLPEPRNYASWRDQVAALEAAASEGTYCENWSLPGGQTFRVTGRPHPDGAIAFLFEDISAEVSLTRHFRAELRTTQGVLDVMPEAVAVFSATGTLTISNARYHDLWGGTGDTDGNDALSENTIQSELRRWQSRTVPTPIWGDVRDFVGAFGDRVEWSDSILLDDGRAADCRFVPLAGGATLASFRIDNRADLRSDNRADLRSDNRADLLSDTHDRIRGKIMADPIPSLGPKTAKPTRRRSGARTTAAQG